MNQLWFKGLDEKQKERRVTLVKNSKRILAALREITDHLSEETLIPAKTEDYKNPGWALEQAHNEGYRRALFELRNIMETYKHDR